MSEDKESSWTHIDFDELEVGDQIGGGGLGIVHKGWWGNDQVALKILANPNLDAATKKEYMDELLVMSKLKHSNIVKFLGACMKPPNLCFVMELCECSLFSLLHTKKILFPPLEIVNMAIDIASAMEYLHSFAPAIIHRDLKSLNVLRGFDGSLKICDFGLVKCRNSEAGTPPYMAPELLEKKPYNKSVDVYAFGILFWEIFASDFPFSGMSREQLVERVIKGDRPYVPYSVNSKCSALIEQCWAQDSAKRPTFTDIVDDLFDIEKSVTADSKNRSESKTAMFDDALDSLISHK